MVINQSITNHDVFTEPWTSKSVFTVPTLGTYQADCCTVNIINNILPVISINLTSAESMYDCCSFVAPCHHIMSRGQGSSRVKQQMWRRRPDALTDSSALLPASVSKPHPLLRWWDASRRTAADRPAAWNMAPGRLWRTADVIAAVVNPRSVSTFISGWQEADVTWCYL